MAFTVIALPHIPSVFRVALFPLPAMVPASVEKVYVKGELRGLTALQTISALSPGLTMDGLAAQEMVAGSSARMANDTAQLAEPPRSSMTRPVMVCWPAGRVAVETETDCEAPINCPSPARH
jgi:hypothetical protein